MKIITQNQIQGGYDIQIYKSRIAPEIERNLQYFTPLSHGLGCIFRSQSIFAFNGSE
jgi:hypothetical protein